MTAMLAPVLTLRSSVRSPLLRQALAILAKYGSAANLYLPGVGAISGITAGNWLGSAGATAATVDNPVGLVVGAGKAVGPELFTGTYLTGPATTAAYSGLVATVTFGGKMNENWTNWLTIPKTSSITTGFMVAEFWAKWVSGGDLQAGRGYTITKTVSAGENGGVRKKYSVTAYSVTGVLEFGSSTAGSVWEIEIISVRELPGAHLTQSTDANRPVLRRGLVNQLTQSDFQNGVTDAPTRGGLVTASTLAGYGGAIAFGYDGATGGYAYKQLAATLNAAYTLAFVVKMDDGNAPVFGNVNIQDASNPFAVVMYGNAYNPIGANGYTVTALADNTYLMTCSAMATTAFATNFGVVKYPNNNNRTFKVTRYGLFEGVVTASQILASGGIPVTTTAPASSTNGPLAWQFDGSNDSFASTLTPGNAGFFCSSANVTDSGVLRTLLGAGAGSDASSGVWLARAASNALTLQVGNGTTRNSVSAAYPVATNAVASAGWDASNMFVGINGAETSGAKSVNCTSANTINVGVLTGTTNPMLGTISGGAIIMPTVLPTASERATLRQFIASLSGVAL